MEINKENNYITLMFDKKVDYKLYEKFTDFQSIESLNFNQIYLDFSKTKFLTLPGIIYILYFLNYLKNKNIFFETRVSNVEDSIARQLAKFGFLQSAKFYGNLFLDSKLNSINNYYISKFSLSEIQHQSSLYLPIRTLPEKSGNHFESDDSSFTNSFIDYFNLLDKRGEFDFLRDKELVEKQFIKTVHELGKNIWEHSQTWGLSAIQSTKKTKTSIVICDNGLGFIGSYKLRNPDYISNPVNDEKLIRWLLEEGNSSKGSNKNGHGLSRVFDFIREVNGILLIKTDSFEITLKDKQKNPTINPSKYFAGTQVFINF